MGLQLLERERNVFEAGGTQPELKGYEYILERQLKPEARRDIIKLLQDQEIQPTAMIDISDGLSSEIRHICKQSACGCAIYIDKVPVDAESSRMAEEFNMAPQTAALNGGEDYELLFTVPIADFDKISSIPEISIIGHIAEKERGCKLIMSNGSEADIKAQGWNAYK